MILFIDTETYSETPIANGTFAYAEKVEVMIVTYAIDDGEVQAWDVTGEEPMPDDLFNALLDDAVEIVVHNSQFDRTVMLLGQLGIELPIHRLHCTMARARAHSLPGGLGKLCEIMGVPTDQAKDKAGKSLIQLFCKPRPKNMTLRRATRKTHPKEWAQFLDYAKSDISAMRVLYKKLPRWNYQGFELDFWRTDTKINERGVAVDLDFVNSAIAATEKAKEELSRKTAEQTNDEVQKTTQRDRLLDFIHKTYGIKFDDLTASMVDKALNDETLPDALKELLMLRSEASLSSSAKYKKFLSATSSDGRLRGMFVFCGASRTGRASGNVVQLHNLPRPSMKNEDIELGIDAIKYGAADLLFPSVMSLASNAIRGSLVPAEGKKFAIADLSNIEGRIIAWLAGEEWKIHAFRMFDTFKLDEHGNKIPDPNKRGEFLREGDDLYNLAYAKAFHISAKSVTKDQRQVGKTMELACGFAGGAGAFNTFATAFNIDLEKLADLAWDGIPSDILEQAELMWGRAVKDGRTYDLSERAFVVSDSLKRMWRAAHPAICNLWYGVENAVRQAVEREGVSFAYKRVSVRRDGAWTRILLPSGRSLCYPSMRVDNNGLSYAGINPYTRTWGRVRTYGGKLVENITQACARDVLVVGIMNAELADYPVVMHIHDEIISEVPDTSEYTAEYLAELMTTNISWVDGLPLSAAGYTASRYRKE